MASLLQGEIQLGCISSCLLELNGDFPTISNISALGLVGELLELLAEQKGRLVAIGDHWGSLGVIGGQWGSLGLFLCFTFGLIEYEVGIHW